MVKEIKICECCGQKVKGVRTIQFYGSLIKSLYEVYCFCKARGNHEFKMKDIRHWLKRNEYARFGDLVYFGGIVYKKEKGEYGINMDRAESYFKGSSTAPLYVEIDPISKQIINSKAGFISEIKTLSDFLTPTMMYDDKTNAYVR